MESNALECENCNKVFSQENCPRILPCFHTFCGPCIDGIIATQKKTCPSCGVEFTAALAKYLMINRSLLLAAEQFGHIIPSKILKEMTKILGAIKILKEMKGGIRNTNKEIETSIKEMIDIIISNEKILVKIDENIKWLMNKMNLIFQEEGKTQDAEAELESETDSTSSEPVMDETQVVLQEGQEKIKKTEDVLLENERERDNITKDIVKMKKQLGEVAKEIRTLKISAVKVIKGKQMVAEVKVMPRNQLQLSHFAQGNVPPKSLIINHESLMERSSRRAFLDLAAEDKKLGRVVIKVMDESNLALHFLHLCAGDLGPSYADSQFLIMEYESEDMKEDEIPMEDESMENLFEKSGCIFVNGCKTLANTTRKAAVTNVDWKEEKKRDIYGKRPHKEGEVRGYFSKRNASQFYIVIKNSSPIKSDNNCFGEVVGGMDVLKDAISRYPSIDDVQIVNCGLLMKSE